MSSLFIRARDWLAGFARARDGNVAMMAGVALPVLLLMSAGAIDLHNFLRVKSELQDALDAASLAAARSPYTDQQRIQEVGMASMVANMPKYYRGNPGDVATFTIVGRDKVVGSATVQVKTLIANTFLPPYGKLFDDYIPVAVGSEVMRASRNVEVAMALDITGSMASYMSDLKSAAKELVGIVVQGEQDVFTTRVALIPYAAGVNVGTLANDMRGALIGPTSVRTADAGQSSNVTPSGWSRNRSVVTINRNNHGLSVGDPIVIYHRVDGKNTYEIYNVASRATNTFTIARDSNLGSNLTYRSCSYADCAVKITSDNHGLRTGDYARIKSVEGLSAANGDYSVTRVDKDNFLVDAEAGYHSSYTRNGSVQCGYDGCDLRLFISQGNVLRELPSSTCVSERPYAQGANKPSDVAPNSASRTNLVGRLYPRSNNPCPSARVTPLTNVTSGANGLNSLIDAYQSGGSTAGQIGIEQAWYAISPNFASIYPAAGQPNPVDITKTIKAVILMTDGDFNTPYCQGVISQDAVDNGSAGEVAYQINCGSTNGNVFAQSVAVCSAMKSQQIVVYTVGFNLGTSKGGAGIDTAYEVMEACATSREHFFPAASGTDLKDAFRAIGRDITRLRIAR